jgi:hypothetical protein
VDGLQRFADIAGIEPNQRVLAYLGAADCFGFDLVDGALGALLGEGWDAQRDEESQGTGQ